MLHLGDVPEPELPGARLGPRAAHAERHLRVGPVGDRRPRLPLPRPAHQLPVRARARGGRHAGRRHARGRRAGARLRGARHRAALPALRRGPAGPLLQRHRGADRGRPADRLLRGHRRRLGRGAGRTPEPAPPCARDADRRGGGADRAVRVLRPRGAARRRDQGRRRGRARRRHHRAADGGGGQAVHAAEAADRGRQAPDAARPRARRWAPTR